MYRVEGEPMSSSIVLVLSRRHTLTSLISRKDTNDTSQLTHLGNSAESPAAHIYEIPTFKFQPRTHAPLFDATMADTVLSNHPL